MNNPFDWEEEWEWLKWDKPTPIAGQLSFFQPDKSSFLNKNKENNIFSSFEDIIFKNPAYTIGELEWLSVEAEEMDS